MKRLPAIIAASVFLIAAAPYAQSKNTDEMPAGEAVVYKKIDGRKLKLYIIKPADWKVTDKSPAIVFFHGGGWVGGKPNQFDNQAKYFSSKGLVCIQVEYRLAKKGDAPLTCVQDAKSSMRWVRGHAEQLGIDANRIASAGGSAGGHLAAFVGMVEGLDDPADDLDVSCKSNAMLLYNPVFDNGPAGYGFERIGERYKEFSPVHNVSSDDPPAIVFLGSRDKHMPVKTLEDFQKAMQEKGVRCDAKIYEGQPHGFFNYGKLDNKYYNITLKETESFLISLGWIKAQ